MKKILVTGGSGFIGENLINKLIKNNQYQIFNLDKLSYASIWKSKISKKFGDLYTLLNIDLINNLEVKKVIDQINPDVVIHMAAETHVDRSIINPMSFLNANIVGTFNLLDAITANWKNNSSSKKEFKFIHISTDEVFGSLDNSGFFSEKTPYNPRSPYSASKASSDHLVNSWHHTYDLPVIITNCSNNYGPCQHYEKLIPKIILNGTLGHEIPLYGDGQNIRDWIFVEDHVNALITIMNNGKIGERYCIGANNELTNKRITEIICSKLDKKIPKAKPYIEQVVFVEDRLGHDFRYALDSSKIKFDLGWQAETSFDKGIEKTINWYLKNLNYIKTIFS